MYRWQWSLLRALSSIPPVRAAHAMGDATVCMWQCITHVSSRLSIMLTRQHRSRICYYIYVSVFVLTSSCDVSRLKHHMMACLVIFRPGSVAGIKSKTGPKVS